MHEYPANPQFPKSHILRKFSPPEALNRNLSEVHVIPRGHLYFLTALHISSAWERQLFTSQAGQLLIIEASRPLLTLWDTSFSSFKLQSCLFFS